MVRNLTWLGVWVLPWVVAIADYLTIWTLWNWFIGPIALPVVIGVVLVFSLILWACTKETSFAIMQLRQALILNFMTKDQQGATTAIKNTVALCVPLTFLLIGYIVKLWL